MFFVRWRPIWYTSSADPRDSFAARVREAPEPPAADAACPSVASCAAIASALALPASIAASLDANSAPVRGVGCWAPAAAVDEAKAREGATLRADDDANLDLYGRRLDNRTILTGDTPVPPGAKVLVDRLSKY